MYVQCYKRVKIWLVHALNVSTHEIFTLASVAQDLKSYPMLIELGKCIRYFCTQWLD